VSRKRVFKTAALAEVNRHIGEVAEALPSQSDEWEFFCECGRPDCSDVVRLTLERYSSLHDSGQAVLAAGHHLSQVERARRLQDDAEALTRQAKHQVDRARQNLRGRGA
jgi:hypothetical protein